FRVVVRVGRRETEREVAVLRGRSGDRQLIVGDREGQAQVGRLIGRRDVVAQARRFRAAGGRDGLIVGRTRGACRQRGGAEDDGSGVDRQRVVLRTLIAL